MDVALREAVGPGKGLVWFVLVTNEDQRPVEIQLVTLGQQRVRLWVVKFVGQPVASSGR